MKKKAIDEDPLVIEKRWQKKRESIETLANNIRSFRNNVTRDLQSEDEKIFLTALAIDLMDTTAERVGNEASASKGHIGITGLKKSNITIDGNKITLRYTGKSGVEHEKSFSDERLAKNLKRAMDISPTKYLLCTSAHFRIKPDRINRFLNEYNLSAKDIRGYSANQWLLEKLRKQDVSPEEKIRKTDFLKAAKAIAQKVGHGLATLRKHYMIPELETEYVQHGRIINIKELGYMKQGGEVEKNSSIEKIDIPNLEVDKFNFRGDGIFDFDEAKKFIKKWLDIDIVKTLGDGTNGIVFLTSDNKAIKLTKSKREAEFWSKLVGVKSDYTPDIYFVKQCGANRREIYVILREPLDEILKNDENYVYWDIMLTLDKRRILEKSNFEEEAQKFEVHWDELPRKLTSDELKIVSGYYKQYQEMRSFFKEKGLKPNDFTTENIGFKSGKLVCFDCQYEKGGEIQKNDKDVELKIDNYTEQYNPDGTMFKPYDLRVEFRDVLFNPSPSEKDIERLNKWLREHKMNYVKMYHGAPAKHVQGILEKGLLPTSDKRRNSYQSQSGYVYLSVLPKSSKIFAELADAHNVENNTVFEVVELVNSLLPDTDQLNNYRSAKENWDIGNSLAESIVYGHGARVKGKIDRNALRIIKEDDMAYFEQGGTLPKPAYLMTLQEYQQTVTPLIQEYNKFVKKNEKFLVKPSYSGIVFKTYPEYRDAFDVSKIVKQSWNNDKDRTDEEFIRKKWNYKKTGVYDNWDIHESQNAPAALVEQNKTYYDKLSAFFTKDELERLIDKDETKSNKRSVRRAIDNGTYKNLLEQEKITIAELKTIADSVDVKIPKRIMDEHRAPDDVYKKVYDAMPAINRAILSKLVEDIKTAFLPMEKSIHARETERYNKEIADVLGRDGFDLIDLNNIIPFAVKIFTFKSEEKTRQREVRNKYGHYIRTVAEPYTYVFDFDLQDNWGQQLEKEVTNYVELLKGQMIQAIIDNFQKITLPITGFTLIRLEEGRKGFEGVIDFAFNNGSSFRFNTEAIGAGGYNIQIYHFRYLHKFTSIKLADGTVTHNEPLSYIIKHFSDAEVSAQVFNPYNTTKNATTLEEIAVPLYKFLKDFGYQIKNVRLNEGKKEISISFQQEERFRFRSRAIYMQREMPLDYNKQKVYKMLASLGVKPPDGFILPEEPAQPKTMKQGGKVEDAVDENKELYARWKKLVNMTYSELKDFYDSAEGKEAGLSKDKADDLGIGSGRESARWIMKMKQTPNEKWTPLMWDWAKRQVSFIARMSGNKGELYDERGNKTRKHLSLLIWGHNPDKLQDGGELKQNSYQQRIADNMKFMGTGFKEWKATPILMFQKTVNKKGEEVSMPVFDFPKDYTHANSLFKMNNDGTVNCELCGRIPINTVFWIQNDTQKLTLGVGSECVKYVGDGSSGKENARKAKLELAKMLDNDLQILSGIVKKNCSRVRNIGYGKQEREWSNMYVGDADFGEFAKKASDAVKSLNPDLLFAPKKYQSDTRGYILWSYVYKTIPVFDYQGELDLVKRNYQTLETADKKLLSWFTRNEEMASRLIPQITGTLEIYLNAPIDYVSDYMKAKDTAPETKLQYGGDITEVTGFLEFTPENIEQVMKSIDLVNLAEQHHVGLGVIEKQFAMGLQIEKEHTNNLLIAAEIVKDHLAESVQYYTLLDEMEKRFELGRVVDYENIDQDIPDELIKYPNLKNGGSVVNQTPPSINSQTTLSCMQNTVNKLTGEHKKAYALCEELCISKKTEFQDATHLLKEWSSVIFNHFQKEESEIFNNSQDEQCKKFLAEHKVFYSLINKIKTRPKKSDIIEFSKLLKQHIIDEETYFSAIQFKNGGLTSSLTLLAPNGKPSNLTPEQYKLVRTPEFIAWFGDWINAPETASKVVDENGEPMVVYHGTRNEFTVFDKKMAKDKEGKSLNLGWGKGVFYFHKNEKTALGYANRKTRNEKYYEGVKSKSLSVFLNIKNTFDVDKNYLRVRANRDGFKDTVSDIWWSKYPDSKNLRREALIKQLKIEGYDGLMDDDEFTVFYPTQIKLADGSNTTFDGSNSDIRFEQGGGILTQNNFIGTWSELQKQKPELWNTGILRRSLNPRGATDIIPADIHTKQGQWQNYGQYDEIEAETIYGKPDNYDYYNDKDGNPIVDIRTGDYLKDKLDYDNNAERIKATISNEQLKNNLIESFDTKQGKEYLSKVIAALPKNPDGSITAYRIGSIGDGIKSYTVSEGMAKTFSNQGTDIMPAGLPSLPSAGYSDFGALPANVVKIDPQGIVAWSPYDSEILVEPKYVKIFDGSNTDIRFEQGGEIKLQPLQDEYRKLNEIASAYDNVVNPKPPLPKATYAENKKFVEDAKQRIKKLKEEALVSLGLNFEPGKKLTINNKDYTVSKKIKANYEDAYILTGSRGGEYVLIFGNPVFAEKFSLFKEQAYGRNYIVNQQPLSMLSDKMAKGGTVSENLDNNEGWMLTRDAYINYAIQYMEHNIESKTFDKNNLGSMYNAELLSSTSEILKLKQGDKETLEWWEEKHKEEVEFALSHKKYQTAILNGIMNYAQAINIISSAKIDIPYDIKNGNSLERELASKKLQKFLSLLKEEEQPLAVVLPKPEIIEPESEPVAEQPSNIIPLPEKENKFYQSVKESLANGAELNNPYLDKLAVKYELTDKADNPNKALIKELTELAICNTSRELASHSASIDARFRSIVDLYYRQPNISHRTSESILLQQYSTPVPICFLAGVFCGINEPEKKVVVYPDVKSAKKVSVGQGYKAFKGIGGSQKYYEVEFMDGYTYSSYRASDRNDAIDEAKKHYYPTFSEQKKNDWIYLFNGLEVFEGKKTIYKITTSLVSKKVTLEYGGINIPAANREYSEPIEFENIDAAKQYVLEAEKPIYFEPSAGNGNMTIAAAPENFIVNEIDKIRNRNLQSVGFKEVLRLDASEPFVGMEKKYDAVLTNPPFGTLDIHKPMGGLPIKKLEHLMAVYALQTMKDNGKCAIIIGGHLKYDEKGRVQSGANRDFYIYLHRFYNVADSINLSGNLYSRQGTSIGIRLILIDGRKAKPEGFPPLENKKLDNVTPGSSAIVNTYDELLERVKNNL